MPQAEAGVPLHVLTGVTDIAHRAGGTFAVIYGAVVIIGGADRWVAPQYRTAMMVPGAPESWGITLLALGVLSLIFSFVLHSHRGMIVTSAVMGLWWTLLASAFAVEVLDNPAISVTSVVGGFGYASIYYAITALALIHMNWAIKSTEE